MAPYFRSLVSDIVNAHCRTEHWGEASLHRNAFKTVQKEIPVLVESVAPCIDEEWYKLVAGRWVISVFANGLPIKILRNKRN